MENNLLGKQILIETGTVAKSGPLIYAKIIAVTVTETSISGWAVQRNVDPGTLRKFSLPDDNIVLSLSD